jgi:hypothetical protein
MNNPFLFLFLNFSVTFVSDIFLNDLSTHFNVLKSLQPYFHNQSIIKCAFYAGLTVAIALLITMVFSYYLFGFIVPTSNNLFYFCILAFVLGYIMDIIIYKFKVFNGLDNYYKTYGAGLLGGVAFVFSILISYFIQKHISIKL